MAEATFGSVTTTRVLAPLREIEQQDLPTMTRIGADARSLRSGRGVRSAEER